MNINEAARQFFLTFRAAEFFGGVQADASTDTLVVTTRAPVPDPLDRLPHFAGWRVKWVADDTAPPLVGADWIDVEPPRAKGVLTDITAAAFDLAGSK